MVLVTYYVTTLDMVAALADQFDADLSTSHSRILVVDNAHVLEEGVFSGKRHIEIVHGSNSFWEFSAWHEGLRLASRWSGIRTVTLLNDSFQKNWEMSPVSRRIARAMLAEADRGRIAGWLDNFSHFKRPFLARRPNSRLVILPHHKLETLTMSLADAIDRCRQIVKSDGSLFDDASTKTLVAWIRRNANRWDASSLPTRLQRIFVEHHLFDRVPGGDLSLRPRFYLGSLAYGVLRKIHGERR